MVRTCPDEHGNRFYLIRTTTELGGDKPALTCILLCVVTTACFSSIFGAGAVVAIGVIVLPIFMSLGIPKVLATCAFMMSVGAECLSTGTIRTVLCILP